MSDSVSISPSSLSLSPSVSTSNAFFTPREQFTMKKGGIIVTTVTGTLSAICSVLILNVIRMSNQKLSTTYHRMMVLMSIFDIMASVSMALTSLPMPSDDELRFAGPMLGNKVTCQIQGYFVLLGAVSGASLYMCLSWYFVCKMKFKVTSDKMSKIIEPVFILYSVASGLLMSIFFLSRDFIHSTPRHSFCTVGAEHSGCDNRTFDEEYLVCDPDEYKRLDAAIHLSIYLMGFNIIMTVSAAMIIIWTILQNRKYNGKKRNISSDAQANSISEQSDDVEADNEIILTELCQSRVLITQALMYIFAYLITYSSSLLTNMFNFDASGIDAMMVLQSIFLPMQGFWNLLIFLYDKAWLVRHSGPINKSVWETVKTILLYPPDTPEISLPVSLMNMMNEDKDSRKQEISLDPDEARMHIAGIDINDTNDNVDSYRFRRTAEFVDTSTNPKKSLNSNLSIDSPGGFVSFSVESSYRSSIDNP
jgi:hypothetical protein